MRIICLVLVTAFLIVSCKQKKENDFDENDYYRTQGIVLKVNIGFTYARKFTKRLIYAYHLDLSQPLVGYSDEEFAINSNESIVVYVNKKDSLDSFIGHRGVINKEEFIEFRNKILTDTIGRAHV